MNNRDLAIVQIGDLMRQAGFPAGHAADIVERLRQVASTQSAPESRLITPAKARTPDFKNLYKPPEQPDADSLKGKAGKDGLRGASGWGGQGPAGEAVPGPPGANGADGESPDQNALAALIARLIAAALGGISLSLNRVPCRTFKAKFRDCIKREDLADLVPPQGGGQQQCRGIDVCTILENIANRFGNCGTDQRTICTRLLKLEDRMLKVETMVNDDAVEC